MGILPLKKRVNHDKCSFATKQRMFGVFAIYEILRYRGTWFPGSRTLCHPGGPYHLLSNFSIICIVWVIKSYSHTTPLYNFNTAHQLRLPAHQAVKRRQVGFKWRLLHIPLKLGERTPLGGPFPSPRPPDRATLHISRGDLLRMVP